jgi:two-component system, LytTR family, response regulator
MIKSIIIDDEKIGAESLLLLLEKHCPDVMVLASAYSAEDGISAILEHTPQLLFLDIRMPTASGFDVVEATKQIQYEVIFTTAYENYAIQALKLNAVDYILKPIDVQELLIAVDKVRKRIQQKTVSIDPQQLKWLIHKNTGTKKKLPIPSVNGVFMLEIDEIVCMSSDSNYTNVFLKNGQKMLVTKTLKSMEEYLRSEGFLRIHSCHLVSINEIERYIKGDGGQVILKNKMSIPVSRVHKSELLSRLGL